MVHQLTTQVNIRQLQGTLDIYFTIKPYWFLYMHARRSACTHARTHAHTGEPDASFLLSTVLMNVIRLTPHL